MICHNGPISGVSASVKFVATAGYDNQVILWDRKTKTALARGLHDHLANRCEISADEKFLVSASSDYTARLWSLPEMQLQTVFGDHTDDVEMIRISPCGTKVVTGSQDSMVRVFSRDGVLLRKLQGHSGVVSACAWSADGKTLVSSGDDGTIRTWNADTGEQLRVIKLEDVQTDAIVITSQGVIFAGNDAGELIRIDGDRYERLAIHRAGIKNLAVSPDSSMVATMSYDRDLALVRTTGALSVDRKIPIPALIWARACVFQDRETLVFGTFGSSYASFNLRSGQWDFSRIHGTGCLNAVYSWKNELYAVGDAGRVLKFSSDPNQAPKIVAEMGSLCNFLTASGDRLVCGGHLGQVYDALTGEVLLSLKSPINKAIPVGGFLVIATYVGELAIARFTSSGSLELLGEYKVLSNAIKDLCADGMKVFCAGAASDIGIFDLDKMKVIETKLQAHANIVNSCASLGNGHFATVSRDLRLKLWRGVALTETIRSPHDHSIKCATVSKDGRYVATGSYDGKVAIYDRETKTWPVLKKVTAAGISSLTFADAFYASAYDGAIYRIETP